MKSKYQIKHLMVMAYGKLITKNDQKKLGACMNWPDCRVVYLTNRKAAEERKRLEGLKLSKPMMVFEITDRQLELRGKKDNTWMPEMCDRFGRTIMGDHLILPMPTWKQWQSSFVIGKNKAKEVA